MTCGGRCGVAGCAGAVGNGSSRLVPHLRLLLHLLLHAQCAVSQSTPGGEGECTNQIQTNPHAKPSGEANAAAHALMHAHAE